MTIKLWKNFSKRSNSTKQPSTASATEKTVHLKENTSIENPHFILSDTDFDWNYVQAFGHYYTVDDIVSLNASQIEIICSQDYLATYKSAIKGSTQFVEYAAWAIDPYVTDPRLASKNGSVFTTLSGASFFDTTGYYVISSVSSDPSSSGGFATHYILTQAQLTALANDFTTWSDSVIEGLAKKFGNANDALISCRWIPFSYATVTGAGASRTSSTNNIIIGGYGTGKSGHRVINIQPFGTAVGFASVWTDSTVPRWKRVEPYTFMRAYIPFYGVVDLPTLPITEANAFYVSMAIDFITGDTTLKFHTGTEANAFATINFNCGVECLLANRQSNSDSVLSAIGGIVGLATGGPAIPAAVSAVSGMVSSLRSTTSVKGSVAGRSYEVFGTNINLVMETLNTEDGDTADYIAFNGRPYMQMTSLIGASGYTKCRDASVAISGRSGDREAVNSALNSGIYIE